MGKREENWSSGLGLGLAQRPLTLDNPGPHLARARALPEAVSTFELGGISIVFWEKPVLLEGQRSPASVLSEFVLELNVSLPRCTLMPLLPLPRHTPSLPKKE